MKRIAFSLLSVLILVAMALPAGSGAVLAQPSSWPGDTNWTCPTDCYFDPPEDEHPAQLDLIGNDTIGPAAYYYFDTDYAFFRERVVGDPSGPGKFAPNTWVVLFDLPVPGNYEYLLSLNGGDEKVQLWNNTVRENLTWNPLLRDEAEIKIKEYPTDTYARIVLDGTGHYFVDWAINLTDLTNLGIDANTTMYFATSADANNYNKDHLVCYDLPDLVITEKSEAWVSLANKTYNVSYIVCNEGAAAPAGASNTTVTIDGVDVLEDPVPGLATGVCYNSTVGPFTMSGTNDTIMVCADNGSVVAESNEDNNCMENIFDRYNLTISSTSGGSVTTPGEGVSTYDAGTVVDLVATADANYHFVNWTGDIGTMGDANSATTNITMDGDYSIVANFAIDRYDLTTSSTSGGSVTTPGEGVSTYDAGTVVDLVATADADYHFVNWTGDVGTMGDANSATTNITMNGDYSIVANFAIDRYNLTISSTSGGSVTTPGEGVSTYDAGTVVDLVATADADYHFVNWTGNVGTIANVNSANTTITMTGNYSIVANFAQVSYTLTMAVSGNGTTTPTIGGHSYANGTVVNIAATPDAYWYFVNWTGDVTDPDSASTTVTVDASKTVTANFAQVSYTLTMAVSGNGTTTPTIGGHSYANGTVVNIAATPDAYWYFVNWTGDVTDPDSASTTVTVDANKTVTANFAQVSYTLTMAVSGNGTTTPTIGGHSYANGTVVNIAATPDAYWYFVNWTGDVTDPDSASTTVTVDASKTVTANFAQVSYTLTMAVSGNGTTTPTIGGHSYANGTVVNIAATPDAYWYFVNWTGDVTDPDSASTTVTVDANKTVTANFAQVSYTLTMAVSGNGTTTPTIGGHSYANGTVVNIAAAPDAYWYFVNWTGDVADPDSASTTVTVDASKTVTANFAQVSYTLTMAVSGNGTTTPTIGGHSYANGTVVNIAAAPDAYWYFVNWTGDVTDPDSASTTVTVDASKTVTANFVQVSYTLTMAVSGNGTTTPTIGGHSYANGTVVNIAATPDAYWYFVNWTGDVANPDSASTTVTVDASKTVTANFAQVSYTLTMAVSGNGTTSPTIGGHSYANGTVVNIAATPDAYWYFVNWTGDVANPDSASTTVTVDASKTVTANFAQVSYTLTMAVSGNGTTTPTIGGHSYANGTVVNIAATPDAYWYFVNWTGDVANPDSASTTVTVDASKTVTANFAQVSYTLTMAVSGNGTTTPTIGGHSYANGTVVNIAATPDAYWYFVNWTGDVTDPDSASTTVTVDASKTVTANFAQVSYTLTMAVSGNGTTTPTIGGHSYANGTVVNIAATPDAYWYFVNWTGDVANPDSASTTVTVDASKTVTANFAQVSYTLTMAVSGNGTTSPTIGGHSYANGTVVNIAATPDAYWYFVNWTGDVAAPDSASTTVTVDASKTVTANFAQVSYTLTMAVSGNGTTTPTIGGHSYANGTVVNIAATPDAYWYFVNWTGDVANPDSASTTVTVDASKTVTANFAQVSYTLTMAVSGNGTTTPAIGGHSYANGTVVNIAATPDAYWYFVNWTGDVTDPDSASTTVTVDASKTVTANFAQVSYTLTMAVSGNGTTTPTIGGHSYANGTVVNIAATPDAYWYFVNWTGDVAAPDSASTTVTVDASKTVTANFAQVSYTLTMAVSGNGTTTPTIGGHSYANGTVVNIAATPDAYWYFVNWTGDVTNPDSASTTVTVDASKTVTANFVQVSYTLTMAVSGNGTTTPTIGGHSYANGTVVNIAATPDAYWYFVNWTGDVTDPDSASTTVTVDASKTVTANFAQVSYTLTMAVSGNGTTTPTIGGHSYANGTVVNIAATPDAYWYFVNWTGDVTDPDSASTTVTVDANKTVTANFAQVSYTLTMAVSGNGTTSPTIGGHSYANGTVVNIAATPDAYWYFVNWTGDVANPDSASTTVTVDASKTVTANFAQVSYTLTMAVSGNGTTTPTIGGHSYANGTVVNIAATPDAYWYFVNWTGDVTDPDSASTTVTVDANKTVTANFAQVSYTLTMAVSGNGTTTPTIGGHSYANGTVVNIAATPDAYWYFVNWTGDVTDPDSASTTVTVDASKTVTANFVQVSYTLTMAVSGNGTTTPTIGGHSYANGTVVNIAATPDAYWYFVNWTGDVANPDSASTTVTVDASKTVTANFAQVSYTLTMAVSGNGTTTPTIGGHSYANGTVVNIAATPDAYWYFVNWTGDVANPDSASTTVTVDASKTVTANFAQVSYTLTMAVSGNGTTTPTIGGHSYANGTVVNIAATPDAYWYFVNWTGDVADPDSASTTVTVDASKTVTANFAQVSYTLTMAVSGNGTTTPTIGGHSYANGTVVNIAATPDAYWYFVNWTGDVANPDSASTTVTVDANKTVTANFAQVSYTLTMAVSGNGTTTPTIGGHSYANGTVVNIAATPDAYWYFVNWTGDVANPDSASTTVTVDASKTVTANFAQVSYTLTMAVSGNGTTTPAIGGHSYANGTVVNIAATPDAYWYFVNWTGDVANPDSASTTVTVDANKTVTANFAEILPVTYNLTVDVSAGGNVTINDTITPTFYPNITTWDNGTVVNLTAVPDANYTFVNWTGDIGTIGDANSATTNITMDGDYSIVANFEEEPKLCVSPLSLPLTVAPNTTVTTTYTITNCGGGTLNWDSSNVTYDPNGNMTWLSQNITSGSLTVNKSDTVLVTVNTTGLEVGTYNAFITITGSTFVLPIILDVTGTYNLTINSTAGGNVTTPGEGPFTYNASEVVDLVATEDSDYYFVNWTGDVGAIGDANSATTNITMDGDYSITANFEWIGYIPVMRDLPGNNLLPGETRPGRNFTVYVNFTAPADDFNAIGLTDVAPDGWEVEVDKTWCTPEAYSVETWGNKVEVLWDAIDKDVNVTAVYKVTVPTTAKPGINNWTSGVCNVDVAWLEYYVGAGGPYMSCVWGDYKMVVIVPGDIVGKTFDVNHNDLADTNVTLNLDTVGYMRSDISTPDYVNTANITGTYYQVANKTLYFELNANGSTLVHLTPVYHALTTPILLAAGEVFNFSGNYGLIPKACNMSYAQKSVNLWMMDYLYPVEWQLEEWKVNQVIASWQVPWGPPPS